MCSLFAITAMLNQTLISNVKSFPNLLPSPPLPTNILKATTLGYSYFYANILWIQTISYYGDQQEHADFKRLSQQLQSIITLNPNAEHAYYMAATVLPWGTGNTSLSKSIIKKAIHQFPNDWRWSYYYGFNAYWFNQDTDTAKRFLTLSASMDGAPPIISSLALKMQAEYGNIDTALIFLERLIHEKQDPHLRQQLTAQKKALLTEKSLRIVDQWLHALPDRSHDQHDLDRLQAQGYPIDSVLPDGGYVQMNKQGEVISSVAGKRFKTFVSPKLRQQRQ